MGSASISWDTNLDHSVLLNSSTGLFYVFPLSWRKPTQEVKSQDSLDFKRLPGLTSVIYFVTAEKTKHKFWFIWYFPSLKSPPDRYNREYIKKQTQSHLALTFRSVPDQWQRKCSSQPHNRIFYLFFFFLQQKPSQSRANLTFNKHCSALRAAHASSRLGPQSLLPQVCAPDRHRDRAGHAG